MSASLFECTETDSVCEPAEHGVVSARRPAEVAGTYLPALAIHSASSCALYNQVVW